MFRTTFSLNPDIKHKTRCSGNKCMSPPAPLIRLNKRGSGENQGCALQTLACMSTAARDEVINDNH